MLLTCLRWWLDDVVETVHRGLLEMVKIAGGVESVVDLRPAAMMETPALA